MKNVVTGLELQDMVTHWLQVPPNGYLGSGYGSDPQSLLQQPLLSPRADEFVAKLASDVPLIGALPSDSVNLYMQDIPDSNDSKRLLIEVMDSMVSVDNVGVIR